LRCTDIRKAIANWSKKGGLQPGTITHVGEQRSERVRMSVIRYDEKDFVEKRINTVEDSLPLRDKPSVTWLDIDGVHQPEIIEQVGKHFNVHPLVLEDIANTGQRPKIEDYEDYIFIVLRMLRFDEEENETKSEQVSVILGANFVISFQEKERDVFDPIRERLRNSKGRIRKMGADFLAYSLIDAIIDNYFIVLERLGETIEEIEDSLVSNPTAARLQKIHDLRREMIFLRKSVWPLREVISRLERSESPLINEATCAYFRDVYDHAIQVMDAVETFRDMLSGMLDIYLSSVSNRMNEIMKVLTVITTIFIPLTYIAGVYGMNFRYMPELNQTWTYPAILALMFVLAMFMVFFFRRRKWI
jgi:magnesium transporter